MWKINVGILVLGIATFVALLLYSQQKNLTETLSQASLPSIPEIITVENEYIPILPTIDDIFGDHSWVATLSAERITTIVATGDIIPARAVNYQVLSRKDFTWPYLLTADLVKNADLTFINLETPLITSCPVTQEGMVFCGDTNHVQGLVFAGVDVASLANNHAANHGTAGVIATASNLEQHSITPTGIKGAVYKDIKGTKFAFLGYNDISAPQLGVANADEEKIKQEIGEARENADVVIVTYHWGVEYQSRPDTRQKYLGHFTIDSGADIVIGNHPHWVQPIEIYKGKLIAYAHGNYIFDQMWSEKTKEGVIGKYTFYDDQLIDVLYSPIYIEEYGQAKFATGDRGERIIREMREETIKLMVQ